MITDIRLENYKCFAEYTIPLHDLSVLVGNNNAGKSTITEALRIIALVVNKYQNSTYCNAPEWTGITQKGIIPSIKDLDINLNETVFYWYSSPPAIIKANFDTGASIIVYVGLHELFAQIFDEAGKIVRSKAEARGLTIPSVRVLPTVAPLLIKEKRLQDDYVLRSMFSRIAPLHFRNELILCKDKYKQFKQLAESTWNGLRINSLDYPMYGSDDGICLLIQDRDFVAEVGHMGHGLQMWLQIVWFLSLVESDTIVLDEPDIYMHADLQRRLIRLLNNSNYEQVIVATHSVEIISEVNADNLLMIDQTKPKAKFVSSFQGIQGILDHVGTNLNLQLARLWSARRCLLVEGKDIGILKVFQNTLFPESDEPFDVIPNMSVGGWGGWNYAIGSSMFLKNAADERIKVYCIFDRDYHQHEEIERRISQGKRNDIYLHIWSKKEIENYLIVPEAICRLINRDMSTKKKKVDADTIISLLHEITQTLYDATLDAIADEVLKNTRKLAQSSANTQARKLLAAKWGSLEGRIEVVSGKDILTEINNWSQSNFGISFTNKRLAQELTAGEIENEMVQVITAIEANVPFDDD